MQKSLKVLTLLALAGILTLRLGASADEIGVDALITQSPAVVYTGNPVTLALRSPVSDYPSGIETFGVYWKHSNSAWIDSGGSSGTETGITESGGEYVCELHFQTAPHDPGEYRFEGEIYGWIPVSGVSGEYDVYIGEDDHLVFVLPRLVLPVPGALPDVTYTGLPFTPDVEMTNPDTGTALVKDRDYILTYANNISAGIATIIATGIGSYGGTSSVNFQILPNPIPEPVAAAPFTYDGVPKTGAADDEGYTVTGGTGTNAGNYSATASLTDKANTVWSSGGTADISLNWVIQPAALPVSALIPDQVYTGSPITPDVVMINPNTNAPLVKDTDYTLAYSANVNVGTATVTVTGIGYDAGTGTVNYSITPASLPEPANPRPGRVTYTGLPFTPELTFVNPATGIPLAKDTDYTLDWGINLNATDDAVVRANGQGNWTGRISYWFQIQPALLPSAVIQNQVYTGLPLTPDVLMVNTNLDPDARLVQDVDYTLSYENNVNTGTATVTATGKGNWTGSQTATFDIHPKPVPVPAADLLTYNGMEQAGVAGGEGYTVTDGTGTDAGNYTAVATLNSTNYVWEDVAGDSVAIPWRIQPKSVPVPAAFGPFTYDGTLKTGVTVGEGYTVTDGTGTAAGNYTATVMLEVSGNYIWEGGIAEPTSVPWSILPTPLPAIAPLPNIVYTGLPLTPDVVMVNTSRDPDAQLVQGVDYTLSYADNVNVGTATVTVTGIGNYAGTGTVTFSITPSSLPEPALQPDMIHTGYLLTPDVTMVNPNTGDLLAAGTDYLRTWTGNYNVGVAAVIVTGQGNWEGTLAVTFKILPAPLPVPAAIQDQVYTGFNIMPAPVMINPNTGAQLTKEYDYTLAYENNRNAGTATVTATGKGNWKDAHTVTFPILPLQVTPPISNTPQTYTGGELRTAAAGLWYTLEGDHTAANAGSYTAAAVLDDKQNTFWSGGGTADRTLDWVILPAQLPAPASLSPVNYTGEPITPEVSMMNPNTLDPLVRDTDYTLSYENNINAGGLAAVIVTGKGNYTGIVSTSFTILFSPLPTPEALPDVTYTGLPFLPDVVITNPNNDARLVKEVDYLLYWSAYIEAGTATGSVTGWGSWHGTLPVNFTILPAALPDIAPLPAALYTGLPLTPGVVMTNPNTSTSLVKDTDYTLAYSANVGSSTLFRTIC